MKRLNESLAAAGQNVEFEMQYKPYQDGVLSPFLDKVKAELAAGNPSADAYTFRSVDSGLLFNAGLTMDVTDMVPQYAPVFTSKYKSLFPEQLTGVPTGIFSRPVFSRTCLYLKQDFEAAGDFVTTTDGFFKFLDETIVNPKKPYTVKASSIYIVFQWARERGYYALANYGMNGSLFAAVDDPSCTPVLLESIPGFESFLLTLKSHYYDGSLIDFNDQDGMRQVIGMVSNPVEFYSPYAYVWLSPITGEMAAHPFTPDLPNEPAIPAYRNELSIAALCEKERAVDIIQFTEWLYSDQQNYDAVLYGEKGVDFADVGGRYVPLSNGQALKSPGYEKLMSLFFAWPGAEHLCNMDYMRLPACAPSNIEQLKEDSPGQGFPISALFKPDWKKRYEKLSLMLTDEVRAASTERDNAVFTLIGDPAVYTKEAIASGLDKLAKCKNQWLIDQYAGIIKSLKENK